MMKKLLTFLIISVLLITPMQILSASEDDGSFISASFDPESRVLTVHGKDNITLGSPVFIGLASYNTQISTDNPPVISEMVFASNDGIFSFDGKVPSSLDNGKYTVMAGTGARDTMLSCTIILFFEGSEATIDALSAINSENTYQSFANTLSEHSFDVGIDLEAIEDYGVFSKALWGIKEDEGSFSVATITKAASFAMGADVLASTGDVEKVMQGFAIAFDYTYDEYADLDEDLKTVADSILKETSTEKGYISYADLVRVAKVITAPSYGHLKDVIISESENYEIEIDRDYNKLSANNKSKVFKLMFENRQSFKSIEDVSESFEDALDELSSAASNMGAGGGGGGGGGGSVSDSKNHIGDSTNITGLVSPGADVAKRAEFSDIESSFAKESIERLAGLFIINGYADNTFRPEMSVTRAEFCKIVCLAFRFDPSVNDKFADVSMTDWFAPYTGTLSNLGIVRGDGNNFNPSSYITRQDAAVILNNVLKYTGKSQEGQYTFSDNDSVSDYAKQSVSSLASMGYLKGDGVNFYPRNNITRAESAALIDRIHQNLN